MTTQELANILSAKLNAASVDPYCPMGARDILRQYLKSTEAINLSGTEKDLLDVLVELFLSRPQQRESPKGNSSRFIGFTGNLEYPTPVWELALAVSNQLAHPILGAFLDDQILFNKENQGSVSKISSFDFRIHFQRTISRYLEKIAWLRSQPIEKAHQFSDLALSDAVERTAELCAKYNTKNEAKQLLAHLKKLAQKYDAKTSWRWLLPMVKSFVLLATAKNLTGLVEETDQNLFLGYAKKCGEGFSDPDGLFHLIPDANALARIIAKQLGEQNPEQIELQTNIRQIEKVADHRAINGNNMAASTILNQALDLANKLGNPSEVNRITDKQIQYRRKAKENGEIKETTHKLQIEKEQWDQFLAPFANQCTPENALQLWISHPSFLPDYEKLKSNAVQHNSLAAILASTSILSGMGLQLAGEGEERTGKELHVALDVARMVQINTSLFLTPTFGYLIKELGVTVEIVKKKLREWKLFFADNEYSTFQGIDYHFAGEYTASIHILAPQFEALIRRAFHLAGVPGAIQNKISNKEGIEQQETTFGAFFSKPEVEAALGEKLATHFRFVFSNNPGQKLIGLNLRNKVAHGIIEAELLNEATSTLILHCILLLTLLKRSETS